MPAVSKPTEILKIEQLIKPKSFVYLPKEGLQGEVIPSHILWENAEAEYVQISFSSPLKFKEIFNVESYEIQNNSIIVRKVELEGYIGLSFESVKVPDLETIVPVEYSIKLTNGEMIKKEQRIKLFRPQLEINVQTNEISINPETGFVKGRIGIKNVGRGTLIMGISATEDSSMQLETPPEHREFAEKFNSDVVDELSKLAKEYPKFQPAFEKMLEWEKKELIELSSEERNELLEYSKRLASFLASDKNLLQSFVEAYQKALAKNAELIEAIGKFIRVYESLVSKDLLLINPFDEVVLTGERNEIALEIEQTDRVYDDYEDVPLQKIRLVSSHPVRIPIYRLFDWG